MAQSMFAESSSTSYNRNMVFNLEYLYNIDLSVADLDTNWIFSGKTSNKELHVQHDNK